MRGTRGSVSPLFLGLAVTAAVGALGLIGLLRHWRSVVEVQLEIDRCTGEAAQDLAAILGKVERLNLTIELTRAALAASTLLPSARPALTATLAAAAAGQDLLLLKWEGQRLSWQLRMGCLGRRGDVARPLPPIAYRRPPNDPLGPQPLRWPEGEPRELKTWMGHPPRFAAAKVRFDHESHRWRPEWAIPSEPLGSIAP